MAYSVDQFRKLNRPSNMVVTQHSRKRFAERNISLQDICNVFDNGEIIKDYPTDSPFPSCLILGKSNGRSIHVCASIDEDMIYLITAYVPSPDKWEQDLKTRRR